jgi:hypothetical protein
MFRTLLNSRIASVGLAGIIAVGVLGAGGVALADGLPGGGSGTPITASPAAGKHPKLALALLADVVSRSGLDRQAFADGFKHGKTINDILGANAATVKTQVQADASARIADALAKGTINQAQADAANAKLPGALDKLFASTPKHDGKGLKLAAIGKAALQTVADTLHIDVKTLRTDLKGGQTIAQVAGPQTNDVVTALDAKADAAIDKAVTDGKVKAANADALKTKAHEKITDFVNNGRKH